MGQLSLPMLNDTDPKILDEKVGEMRVLILLFCSLLVACSSDDEGSDGDDGNGGVQDVHPAGFVAADQHGQAFNLNFLNCSTSGCHGENLLGAEDVDANPNAASCDACHTPGDPQAWRTDCTFCHGGTINQTGAPPENLDNSDDYTGGQFTAHIPHTADGNAAGFLCEQCHAKPVGLLDPGHVLDDTPGQAEINFATSISDQGTYDAETKTCSNLYCHGDGQADNGVITDGAGRRDCASCHPGNDSVDDWVNMSGAHDLHLQDNEINCSNCHADTTFNNVAILILENHINKVKDVVFDVDTIAFDADLGTCNGTCHGRDHVDFSW